MNDYPKEIKKLIRKHSEMAYEEELRQALTPLSESFEAWRNRSINSFELSDKIHEFHDGISRELFKMHTGPMKIVGLAKAIANNIIDRKDIPQKLLRELEHKIKCYEEEA
jgi:hypothetical protein